MSTVNGPNSSPHLKSLLTGENDKVFEKYQEKTPGTNPPDEQVMPTGEKIKNIIDTKLPKENPKVNQTKRNITSKSDSLFSRLPSFPSISNIFRSFLNLFSCAAADPNKPRGLANGLLGFGGIGANRNLCYMNSSLQCILNDPVYKEKIKNLDLKNLEENIDNEKNDKISKIIKECRTEKQSWKEALERRKGEVSTINTKILKSHDPVLKESLQKRKENLEKAIETRQKKLDNREQTKENSTKQVRIEAKSKLAVAKELQAVQKVYDNPASTPSEIQNAVLKLRDTLFNQGRSAWKKNAIRSQQDAAAFMEEIAAVIDVPTIEIEARKQPVSDLKTQEHSGELRNEKISTTKLQLKFKEGKLNLQDQVNQKAAKTFNENSIAKTELTLDQLDGIDPKESFPGYFISEQAVGAAPASFFFQVERFTSERKKIRSNIELPEGNILDVSTFYGKNKGEVQYRLNSFVVHQGTTVNSGHYISYVCKQEDGKSVWYKCNDSKIEKIPTGKVPFGSAYILNFEKVQNPEVKGGLPL